MLNAIMTQVNNHFGRTVETGKFSINGKVISGLNVTDFIVGQYVWVNGSILNDDVYKIASIGTNSITLDSTSDLTAETSDFTVFGLAVPKDFLALVSEVEAYAAKNAGLDGVTSETIGKYSVSFKDGGGWSEVFRTRLNKYRRVYDSCLRMDVSYNWQNRMDL